VIASTQPSTGGAGTGIDLTPASLGAYGELLKRANAQPLAFRFEWRGVDFQGLVSGRDDGLRMSIETSLAALPYTSESPAAREELLAVIDTLCDPNIGRIRVVQGHKIILENEFELPDNIGTTINSIVVTLTIMVLRATPYLQALGEYIDERTGRQPKPGETFSAEKDLPTRDGTFTAARQARQK
jgi:hypothetical protein